MAEDTAVFDSGSAPDAALPSYDTGVIIGEDNLQEQRDEVLAIQSIYEGEERVELYVLREPDENGHGFFQMQIKIPVITPENCQVDLMLPIPAASGVDEEGGAKGAEGGQPGEEGAESVPKGEEQGARAQTPPPRVGKGVALQRSLSGHRWTGSFKVKYLCPMTLHLTLPPTYPSHSPPAFALSCTWLRHTQVAALCKQLDKQWEANPHMPVIFSWVDWLENETLSFLGLTNNFVLMPENKEECKNGDDDEVDGRALSECWDLGEAVHTMLQYSEQKEAVEFCKGMQECCLCLDEKPGTHFFRLVPCKHHFCFDCLATHCSLHVMEGTIQLLTCPASECETMVSPDILQSVLSPEAFVRWETISLQRSLDEMDDVVYCPRCQAVVIREQDMTLNLGYCLACCFSFCTDCEQPWHQGTACQSEMDRLEEKAGRIQAKDELARKRFEALVAEEQEKQKSLLIIRSKTKKCPSCKIPVEKISGCNKMTCRCGKSFCWLCGKEIKGYDHFRVSPNCNLFVNTETYIAAHVQQRRIPNGLLWMRAQAEGLDDLQNRETRCTQCKQLIIKVDNNNHLRCWNCKTQVCFHCSSRIIGSASQHFGPGLCPQHS